MTDNNSTRVIEGVLTEDSTPLTFRLAEEIEAATKAFNGGEKDLAQLVALLAEQNRLLMVTVGRLELAVNMHAGDAFTGRPTEGSMTVDR